MQSVAMPKTTQQYIHYTVCTSENTIITVCNGPTCKGKKTFTLTGGGVRRPENNIRWLTPSKKFQKKVGALYLGHCT